MERRDGRVERRMGMGGSDKRWKDEKSLPL